MPEQSKTASNLRGRRWKFQIVKKKETSVILPRYSYPTRKSSEWWMLQKTFSPILFVLVRRGECPKRELTCRIRGEAVPPEGKHHQYLTAEIEKKKQSSSENFFWSYLYNRIHKTRFYNKLICVRKADRQMSNLASSFSLSRK